MDRRRVVFSGHVQGVGFRATARHLAHSAAVSGWVRNEPDGSVTLEVQGIPPDIETYLDHLRTSMGRHIRHELSSTIAAIPGEVDFRIAR